MQNLGVSQNIPLLVFWEECGSFQNMFYDSTCLITFDIGLEICLYTTSTK